MGNFFGKIVGNYSPFTLEIFSLIVSYKKRRQPNMSKKRGRERGWGVTERERKKRGKTE